MKRIFLMGFATAAMLVSCNQDEIVDLPQSSSAIQFKSFVNNSTRATDLTEQTFDQFQVWGLMEKDGQTGTPFVGTIVSKGDDGWSYQTPVYWENGYKYSFVAIAPEATNSNWSFSAPDVVGNWGSITFSNGDGTTDLVYAIDGTYAIDPVELNGEQCPMPISLTFNHLLSRVKFAFTNAMDDGSVINVTGVKIKDANMKAIATLDETATWALASDNVPAELSFGDVKLEGSGDFAGNETKETDHKYMIPQLSEGQVYNVAFTVTRTHHGVTDEYTHEVQLPEMTWTAGHSYAFVAKLSAENIDPDTQLCPIEFTANIDPWEDFNDPGTELPVESAEAGESN